MKKLFLYIFLVLMWCNVSFAEKFIYTCESKSPKDHAGFQRIYSIDTNKKTINHTSSYDTNTNKTYVGRGFENIIHWSKDLVISYNIDDNDFTANYETYSFINDRLIVSAHYPKGDMPLSDDSIDKYYFNQLYHCSRSNS